MSLITLSSDQGKPVEFENAFGVHQIGFGALMSFWKSDCFVARNGTIRPLKAKYQWHTDRCVLQ